MNAKGKPMDDVPLVMMAATKIGERQGQELYKEMQKRGWNAAIPALWRSRLTNWTLRVAALPAQWTR